MQRLEDEGFRNSRGKNQFEVDVLAMETSNSEKTIKETSDYDLTRDKREIIST